MTDAKNIALFAKYKVLSEREIRSRKEIYLENYCHVQTIEALTMIDMAQKLILPSVEKHLGDLSHVANEMTTCNLDTTLIKAKLDRTLLYYSTARKQLSDLQTLVEQTHTEGNAEKCAVFIKEHILPSMACLRTSCDTLEELTPKQYWPLPSYKDILFSIS